MEKDKEDHEILKKQLVELFNKNFELNVKEVLFDKIDQVFNLI